LRGAQAASALNHPTLITVFDVLHTDGHCAGDRTGGRATDAGIVRRAQSGAGSGGMGNKVARGLAAAHGQGLFTRTSSRRRDGRTDATSRSSTLVWRSRRSLGRCRGIPLGTLGYMSPEQTRCETLSGAGCFFAWGDAAGTQLGRHLVSGKHGCFDHRAILLSSRRCQSQPPLGDREFVHAVGAMLPRTGRSPGSSEVAAKLEAIAGHRSAALRPKIAGRGGLLLLAARCRGNLAPRKGGFDRRGSPYV